MSSWYSRTYGASRVSARTTHDRKYRVGTLVRLLGNLTDPRARDRKSALHDAWFQVTQLLPAESLGFQYRIKNMTTGLEFVIVEDQIAPDAEAAHVGFGDLQEAGLR